MGRDLPSNWDSIRKQALERDDYTCGNCSRKGGPYGKKQLEIHHIVERRNGGTHNLSNLRTLCQECHAAITYDQTAPTANRQSSVGFEKRGEFRRYQEFIETFDETIDQFNQFVNSDVREFGQLIQRGAAFINEDRPLPPEFADSYANAHSQAEKGAREFQEQLNNFRDTSIEPFSDETTERYNRLLNQWLSTVFNGQELTESADEFIEIDGNQVTILTDTEAESDFVEVQQEYMESAQAASKTIDRLDKSLASDLEKIQDEIESQDTQGSVIRSILSAVGLEGVLNDFRERGGENVVFDGCPVCGNDSLSRDKSIPPQIMSCESCNARFKQEFWESTLQAKWTMVEGDSESVGETRKVTEWRDF
jgi:hypothetical protein